MAWNRSSDPPSPTPTPPPTAPPPRPVATAPTPAPEPVRRNDRTVIGPSICIKGDLSGDEDVLVEGRVEGKIELKQNSITIGTSGKVQADLYGRTVTIEGEVEGNVFAREQAVVRPSGTVHGNISAPRVVLEDGAKFKGSIDMETKEAARPAVSASTSAPAPSSPLASSGGSGGSGSGAGTSAASESAPAAKADS